MQITGKKLYTVLLVVVAFALSAMAAIAISMWYSTPSEPQLPNSASLPSTPGVPPESLLGAVEASGEVEGESGAEEPALDSEAEGEVESAAIEVEFTETEE